MLNATSRKAFQLQHCWTNYFSRCG